MPEIKDQWIWLVDDELIPALLKLEPNDGQLKKRAASSEAFVNAVNQHLQGNTEQALAELSRGASNPKHAAECYAAMGHIQFELERYEEAAASYGKAAAADNQNKSAAFNQGLFWDNLKRFKEEAMACEKAAQADPNRPEPRFALGVFLLHLMKPQQAQDTFE